MKKKRWAVDGGGDGLKKMGTLKLIWRFPTSIIVLVYTLAWFSINIPTQHNSLFLSLSLLIHSFFPFLICNSTASSSCNPTLNQCTATSTANLISYYEFWSIFVDYGRQKLPISLLWKLLRNALFSLLASQNRSFPTPISFKPSVTLLCLFLWYLDHRIVENN